MEDCDLLGEIYHFSVQVYCYWDLFAFYYIHVTVFADCDYLFVEIRIDLDEVEILFLHSGVLLEDQKLRVGVSFFTEEIAEYFGVVEIHPMCAFFIDIAVFNGISSVVGMQFVHFVYVLPCC